MGFSSRPTGSRPSLRDVSNWTVSVYDAALATPLAQNLDSLMKAKFEGAASVYSKAMDAEYLRTHIGGGWHRLYDGGHDPYGAWRAIRGALPNDSAADEILAFFREYWHDLVTTRGMPVATFDKTWLNSVCASLADNLGVTSAWVRDMLTFTSTELGGGIAALAALLINLRSKDPDRYLQLCGSLGVSALAAANPITATVMISALLLAASRLPNPDRRATGWRKAIAISKHAGRRSGLIIKGATFTSATILTTTLIGGPVGLAAGTAVSIAVPLAWLSIERQLKRQMALQCAQVLVTEIVRARYALPAPSASGGGGQFGSVA